jgi:hypothetical protein
MPIVQPMVSRAPLKYHQLNDQETTPRRVYGMASILGATLVALLTDLRKKWVTA